MREYFMSESKRVQPGITKKGLVVLDWDKTILRSHSHNITTALINGFNKEVSSESLTAIKEEQEQLGNIHPDEATALFEFLNKNLDKLQVIAARYQEIKSKNFGAALNQAMTDLLPLIKPFLSPVGGHEVWQGFFKECDQQGYGVAIVTWGSDQSKNILIPYYLEHVFKLDKELREKIYIEPFAKPTHVKDGAKNRSIECCDSYFNFPGTLIFGDDTKTNLKAAETLKTRGVFKNYVPLVANQTEPVCLEMSAAMKKLSAESDQSVEHIASSSSTTSAVSSVSTMVSNEQSSLPVEEKKSSTVKMKEAMRKASTELDKPVGPVVSSSSTISASSVSTMVSSEQGTSLIEEEKNSSRDSLVRVKEEIKDVSGKLYGRFPTHAEVKADKNKNVVLSDHLPVEFKGVPWGIKPLSYNVMSPHQNGNSYKDELGEEDFSSQRPERVAQHILSLVKENGHNLIALQELTDTAGGHSFFGGGTWNNGWTERLAAKLKEQTGKSWDFIVGSNGLALLCDTRLGKLSNLRTNEEERHMTLTLILKDNAGRVEVNNVHLKHDVDPAVQREIVTQLLDPANSMVVGDFNARIRSAPEFKTGNMINNLTPKQIMDNHDDLPKETGCDATDGCLFKQGGGPIEQAIRIPFGSDAKPLGTIKLDHSKLTDRQKDEVKRPRPFLDMDHRITALKILNLREGEPAVTIREYESYLKQRRVELVNEDLRQNFSVALIDNLEGEMHEGGMPTKVSVRLPWRFFNTVKNEFDELAQRPESSESSDPEAWKQWREWDAMDYRRDEENRKEYGFFIVPINLFPKFNQLVERIYPKQIQTAKAALEQENTKVEEKLQVKKITRADWNYSGVGATTMLVRLSLLNKTVNEVQKLLADKNYSEAHKLFLDLMDKMESEALFYSSDAVTQAETNKFYSEFRQCVNNLSALSRDINRALKIPEGHKDFAELKNLTDKIAILEQIIDKTPGRGREIKGQAPRVYQGKNMQGCVQAMARSKTETLQPKLVLPVMRADVDGIIPKLKGELKSTWYKEARGLTLFKALHNFEPLPDKFSKDDLFVAMKELASSLSYLQWFSKHEAVKDLGKAKTNPKGAEALSVVYSVWRKFDSVFGEQLTRSERDGMYSMLAEFRQDYEQHYLGINPHKNAVSMFGNGSAPASGVNPQPQQSASSQTSASSFENIVDLNVLK